MGIPGDGECKQIEAELRRRSHRPAGEERGGEPRPTGSDWLFLSPPQSLVVHQRLDLVHQLPCDLQDVLDVVTLGHFCGMCTFV